MYKKATLLIAACLVFTLFIFLKKEESKTGEEVSGAYEALNFLGNIQTYPSGVLPANAHFAAWKSSARMDRAENAARSTEPWQSMGPHNRGGRMLSIVFNPQNPKTMYAGSASGGLWRTHTAGVGVAAWQKVETGFPVLGVSCIEFMPADSMRMFIGTGEVYNHTSAGTGAAYRNTRGSYGMGILRTKDGGATWTKSLDFSYDQNKGIWDIEIAPSNPNIIYAATTDGVYKSTNGGNSWNWIFDVVMATDLVVHPADPNRVIVGCGNFSSPGYGIYRTNDGGTFWFKVTSSELPAVYKGKIQLGMAPSSPNIVYASIGNGFSSAEGASWLCRSDDFGQTWKLKTTTDYSQFQGWFSHDVAVNPVNPDEVIVIGIEVWRSTDAGATITKKSVGGVGYANPPVAGPDGDPTYVHSDVHDVVYHPTLPNVFYVASDGGIHRSLDGGETYHSCNGSLQTTQFYNGFSNSAQNQQICMGGLQDNGTIQWNGDFTWTRIGGGDGSWTAINQQDDKIFYRSSQYLNVTKVNNGTNIGMSIPSNNPVFIAPYIIAPSNGNILYAGSAVVSKTTDGGTTWVATNGGNILDGNPVLSMSMSHQSTEVVYAATAPWDGNPGNVFVTLDGGATWDIITGNLPDRFAMDLEVDPANDAVAYVSFSGYGSGHLFRTTDYGAAWEDITGDLPDVPTNAIAVDPLFPHNIYAGNDLGVFASIDNGATWMTYHQGLPEAVMVFDLKISPANRKLRIASHGNGAFQRDLLEEPLVVVADILTTKKLRMNMAPNPARNHGTLRYYLPSIQAAEIDILDSNGQIIKTFQQEAKGQGWQELSVPVHAWQPGIYFARVRSNGRAGVQKFVVL